MPVPPPPPPVAPLSVSRKVSAASFKSSSAMATSTVWSAAESKVNVPPALAGVV